MSKYIIRPVLQKDLPQVIALDKALFGWYGANEDPTVIRARLQVFPKGFIVMEYDDAVIGYVSTEKWSHHREPALDEDPLFTHDPAGHILCITTLAVASDWQGQGLGSHLLNHVIDMARQQNCTEIILETAHAANFYLRAGFCEVKERSQRGIDLKVLKLDISN